MILNAMHGVPGMSMSEIERFLSDGKMILRLASTDENGDPMIHSVWFILQNGKLYFFTEKTSRKIRNLTRSQRAYFSIDSEREPYIGVKGRANALVVDDRARVEDIAKVIVTKYLGGLDNPYAQSLLSELGASVAVELTPVYFSTWDYRKMTTNS
jgi:nitroimidazol reductase NimA-like FMN-containing flavoprotein (pyridoxamine 5'-phosphate oxidase superfamily)